MKNSKTFRLFISSTFNDFQEERKVLQTKVFPIIKDYCSEKGYRFQPIDLRWGINNEAQLDQKTLELCLDEVKSCKSYPYPNFLVMLGDRYGWIPLPYCIEKNEFEELLSIATNEDEKLLSEWYQLDYNQLPASYFLKHRDGKFENFDKWNNIENYLINVLQQSVNNSSLSNEQKRKYFTSATEAEIEEGIIPYLNPTSHQKKLIKENPTIEKEDTDYVFGFLRNIDFNTKQSEKFITSDYQRAQELKTQVKEILKNSNVLESSTSQLKDTDLDDSYLSDFESRLIPFLKEKLDTQILKEKSFTELQIEQQEQEYFAEQKRLNFIGQESILKKIQNYIENDSQQPFVLYGKSGSGKSSIMAQAINLVSKKAKVIYRFVGATSNTSSSTSLLTSILSELGINLEKELNIKPNVDAKKETFEEFCLRIKNVLLTIKVELIIFIDAVDQLANDDQFLWLPYILPENIKIIISALNDPNYQADSSYFKFLTKITPNTNLVSDFNNPKKLLKNLLQKENRTLQEHQLKYFLNQYKSIQTPLYIYVTSQEIKHWKSYDLTKEQSLVESYKIQDLANSQKGAIEEFIKNLSKVFHHDKEFVEKILSLIYISKDGLSENEILELINTDVSLIQKLAPDTWHTNISKELPLVIWSRLYTHLKPFLRIKNQDNEKLLFFFHREFKGVIKNNINHTVENEDLIDRLQILILKNQNSNYLKNRWGKLYHLQILQNRLETTSNKPYFFKYSLFIANLKNDLWIEFYFYHSIHDANMLSKMNLIRPSIIILDYLQHISIIKSKNNEKWEINYCECIINLSYAYSKIKDYTMSLKFAETAFNKINLIHSKYPNKKRISNMFINISINFGAECIKTNQYQKGLNIFISTNSVLESFYNSDPEYWVKEYVRQLINIAEANVVLKNYTESLIYDRKAVDTIIPFYENNPIKYENDYSIALYHLAHSYRKNNRLDKSIPLELISLKIREKLYEYNPFIYTEEYVIVLINLGVSYRKINKFPESYSMSLKAVNLLKPLYKINPVFWDELYTESLFYLNDVLHSLGKINECIKNAELLLNILNELNIQKPYLWEVKYFKVLRNISIYYYDLRNYRASEKFINKRISCLFSKTELDYSLIIDSYNILKVINIANQQEDENEQIDFLINFYKSKKELSIDTEKWIYKYLLNIKKLVAFYYNKNMMDNAIKFNEVSIFELENLYQINAEWRTLLVRSLKLQMMFFIEIKNNKGLEEIKTKYKNIL
ncbi:DUF4062 domain-containing protein [uncultured Lutibacter sp.]|uniref:DUF4062 domain-containing protein n=1 Tax=uncultured Lutibacter sp. TaxID=437739 RepID=UPI002628F797|nr:DUF4062 domain-containing protein [uncultured Lutibacter sp.]